MLWRAWVPLLALLALTASCRRSAPRACMAMGAPSPLYTGAALVRLDVYDTYGDLGAFCAGATLASGAGAPTLSRSFMPGAPVTLDVAPGRHTLLLSTFSDAAGTMLLGTACTEVTFLPGVQACIDLLLSPAPDGGVDLSACSGDASCPCTGDSECVGSSRPRCGPAHTCVECLPTPDNCPFNQYCTAGFFCAGGCKASSECAALVSPGDGGAGDGGIAANLPLCELTRHRCVECLRTADCVGGQICSPSFACVDGCDSAHPCASVTRTCCGALCVDPTSDVLNCNGCGMSCVGTQTQCCNRACSNPMSDVNNCGGCQRPCSLPHATPSCVNALCAIASCNPGWGDCNGLAADGCETPTNTISNCSACGQRCDAAHSLGASCSGATCLYTGCVAGWGNCVTTAPDTGGCETDLNTITDCGACRRACSSLNVAMRACAAGLCNSTCGSGFANCSQPAAPTPDNGCETNTNTPATCGSCSLSCSLPNATAACPSGSCTIASCSPGFKDCDGAAANGCECAGSACCGSACQTKHANGLGQNFFDCAAVGTHDQTQATGAAQAWNPTGTIFMGTCTAMVGTVTSMCDQTATSCACWAYSDTGNGATGHVKLNTASSMCQCADSTTPTWN